MKKVLYVAHLQSHIRNFHLAYLKHLKDRGFYVAVATRVDNFAELAFLDEVIDFPFIRSPFTFKTLDNYIQFKKLLAINDYDVIHCHTPVAGIITRLAAHRMKVNSKIYYTAHGFHFYTGAPLTNWLIYYPAEYICSKFTDVLFTINQEDFSRAKTKFKHPKIVLVNGIGINVNFGCIEYDQSKTTVDLLSVGELNKNKNHMLVLKALVKLNNKNIHYYIAGEGELKNDLVKYAQNNGFENNLHLLGFVKNIHQIYLSKDIFIFPSKREGLSVSLMDAMAAGMPCIVTDIRGNKDLIDTNGGMFIDNNVDSVVERIQEMIDLKDQWKKMGLYNRKQVKKYSRDIVFNQLDEYYKA